MTYLTIPDELDKRLKAFAAKAQLSSNEYALRAIEEYLEDQEDYLEALEISQRIECGEEKTFSYEEVLKELGLETDNSH